MSPAERHVHVFASSRLVRGGRAWTCRLCGTVKIAHKEAAR